MNRKKVIGITDCSKYPNYEKWILGEPDTQVIKLSYGVNNFEDIRKCDALLLTGGEDVHPRFYQKPEYLPLCDKDNMDEKRDEFELKVMEFTQVHKVPVLGICRGLQVANVFFGGTLIADITSTGKPDHAKLKGTDRTHAVTIADGSLLEKIAGTKTGNVNSAHHQSADRIGKGLTINALSADGTVEGLERQDSRNQSFLLLVQWHPERMIDQQSPLVRNIKNSFLNSIEH